MAGWSRDELSRIDGAEEVDVASLTRSGAVRNRVTIWVVRNGNDFYVRSVKGRKGAWFLAAQAAKSGRIWAGAVTHDIAFEEADPALGGEIDAAYRSKYGRYAGRILNSVLTPDARATTLRLIPR